MQAPSPEDIDLISTLAGTTFFETYKDISPQEFLKAYIAESFSPAQILREISESETHSYYLFRLGTTVVGYAKTSRKPEPAEVQRRPSLYLERFYLDKKFQGQGLGRRMLESLLELEKNKAQFLSLWLSVFELNTEAIGFYQHHGFQQIGFIDFKMTHNGTTRVERDLLLERPLK